MSLKENAITIGAIGIIGYVLYQKFLHPNNVQTKSEGVNFGQATFGGANNVYFADLQNRVATSYVNPLTHNSTTYFFTKDEINSINPVQQFLLKIGVSPSVVFW